MVFLFCNFVTCTMIELLYYNRHDECPSDHGSNFLLLDSDTLVWSLLVIDVSQAGKTILSFLLSCSIDQGDFSVRSFKFHHRHFSWISLKRLNYFSLSLFKTDHIVTHAFVGTWPLKILGLYKCFYQWAFSLLEATSDATGVRSTSCMDNFSPMTSCLTSFR